MDKILAKLGQAQEYIFIKPKNTRRNLSQIMRDLTDLSKPEDSLGLNTEYGQKIRNVGPSLAVIDGPADF